MQLLILADILVLSRPVMHCRAAGALAWAAGWAAWVVLVVVAGGSVLCQFVHNGTPAELLMIVHIH